MGIRQTVGVIFDSISEVISETLGVVTTVSRTLNKTAMLAEGEVDILSKELQLEGQARLQVLEAKAKT